MLFSPLQIKRLTVFHTYINVLTLITAAQISGNAALLDFAGYNTFVFQLSIGVAVLCLPWLRWAQPKLPRPIKVNLVFPIVYIIASLFVTIVPMIASPVETGKPSHMRFEFFIVGESVNFARMCYQIVHCSLGTWFIYWCFSPCESYSGIFHDLI